MTETNLINKVIVVPIHENRYVHFEKWLNKFNLIIISIDRA